MMKRLNSILLAASVGLGLSASAANAAAVLPYFQTNLVSNLALPGVVQDPNLQNPWGVSESATSPLWISDQHASVATLYTLSGLTATPAGGSPPLVVSVPSPTGQVNNSIGGVATSSFLTTQSGAASPGVAAHFIFASLNGSIYAWAAAMGPTPDTAALAVSGASGASYTGLAIGGTTAAPLLYAADNGLGTVDVFNGSFTQVSPGPGAFANPFTSLGLVPFNVQNINGMIYVTYALPGHGSETSAGPGEGAVAIFTESGTLLFSFTSPDLASPWGIALAPADFGPYSNDLLVGNFAYGNLSSVGGEINAYNPTTGAFLGTLDSNSAWQGLWALTFGSGSASGGSSDILYFTTGLESETNGLFAALSVVPEPSSLALLGAALAFFGACRVRSRRGA